MASNNLVQDYAALFAGNLRSYGEWNPDTGNMITHKGEVPIEAYEAHLAGTRGLGIVPITDGGTCLFGAIDIDKHESPEDVDFAALAAKIRE